MSRREMLLSILLIVVFGFGLAYLESQGKIDFGKIKLVHKKDRGNNFPERIGEKITYDIKFGKIYLGKAKFNRMPRAELDGKSVDIMTFETKLARFTDKEKIYSDPDNFLPIRVERDISTWPIPEKITEYYNQENFSLKIHKFKGRKEEEMVINKDSPIHNAILLPYYVRRIPELAIGWVLKANLPTREFEIKLVSIENVKVPAGIFKAYRFSSVPKRFEIWISADERRIPIIIKDTGNLGYALFMKEYSL